MKKAIINRLEALEHSGAEALNAICSNLTFAAKESRKIMLTSASEHAGKSYLAMHMLNNLARRGLRVLLVDGDLRRSALTDEYGIEQTGAGLADYLSGDCQVEDVLYETNLPGASLIPQGHAVADPVPLLHARKLAELLDEMATRFDLVLVDTPSVGLVVDAAEIAAHCDGAVLVCEYGKTRRGELLQAKRQIEAARCPVMGCVINKVTLNTLSARKYYNREMYKRMKRGYYDQNKQ